MVMTTAEIIIANYPYLDEKDDLFKLWNKKHPTDAKKKWFSEDEVAQFITALRIELDACEEFCKELPYHHIEYSDFKSALEKAIEHLKGE